MTEQTNPRSRSGSLSPAPEYVPQPDHFYLVTATSTPFASTSTSSDSNSGSRYQLKMNVSRDLRPEDDPTASRGIPVFKPTWWEFQDFERYMKSIECWGTRSGIVKVIPPQQWIDSLPDCRPLLQNVRIKHPIEQNMLGRSGLFRQQNIERRRVYSLREWFEAGLSDEFRTPTGDEVLHKNRARGSTSASTSRGNRAKKAGSLVPETVAPLSPSPAPPLKKDMRSQTRQNSVEDGESDVEPKEENVVNDSIPPAVNGHVNGGFHVFPAVDSTPSGELDEAAIAAQAAAATLKAQKLAQARERKAARAALKGDLDAQFLETFDPKTSWLPSGSAAEEYASLEFIDALERSYWRSVGVGKEAMYGADLPGSLFSTNLGASYALSSTADDDYSIGIDKTWRVKNPATEKKAIPWDVSNLPSALTRLLPRGMKLPGVNTPYLYFGMWKATFAWHVEDMDLFSINYLHWGAPKHWYAVPQARANALESAMRTFFPTDKNGCPQFLRHKSYLASPSVLRSAQVKPNALVQNAGEFVITYPRGYHAGFNTGLNCAESVNFALDSWLDLGRKAKFCRCISDSVRIDVDALLNEKARIEAEEQAGLRRPQSDIRQARVKPILPPQAHVAPPLTNRPRKRKFDDDGVSVGSSKPELSSMVLYPPTKKVKNQVSTTILPCVLCASADREGLLPVNDKPFAIMGVPTPIGEDGNEEWMAHETCAMVIPETWVDEVNGEKRVFGVDGISKDRWGLRCGACSDPSFKAHGAPIQCTKGKCSKAYHVGCAREGKSGTSFSVLAEQELEVLITADTVPVVDSSLVENSNVEAGGHPSTSSDQLVGINGALVDQSTHRVLKTIKKLTVELLCSQHNPKHASDKRNAKREAIFQKLSSMSSYGRVKIKVASGIFECTIVGFDKESETIQVLWTNGERKTYNWSSIVWNDSQGAMTKQVPQTPGTSVTKAARTKKQPIKPAQSHPLSNTHGLYASEISGTPALQSYPNQHYQPLYQDQALSHHATYPINTSNGALAPTQAPKGPSNGEMRDSETRSGIPKPNPVTRAEGSSSASSDVDVSMTSHGDEGKHNSSMDGSV